MVNADRIASEFAHMAAIASPSFKEGPMADYLTERLKRLGATVVMDGAAARCGSECGNLIATIPGSGGGGEPFMLSVHMDTVEPVKGVQPVLADGVFTSAGDTVLGADDKAGIAEIIEALEVVREQNIPHGPIEIVVTVCEEVGLLGAKHLDFSKVFARRGLALDTSGVDLAIHRAPCADKLRFEIEGREAHAGFSPEKGISAIEVAARAIGRMQLGRLDDETTANIGTINGGQATNIVAKKVVIEGEARSHDPDKLARQSAHMAACFEEAVEFFSREIDGEMVRPQLRTEQMADYPVMNVPLSAPIVELVQNASAALGRELTVKAAGGGSDANIFNERGIETIILGTGMEQVHSVEESVAVADMVRVAELLVEVIRQA